MKYQIYKAEPGYSGSEEMVEKGLTLNEVMSKLFELRRAYKKAPEDNESYAFIMAEMPDDFERESQVFGMHFDTSCPEIWRVRSDISSATKDLLK
jgi:hypothetical protein